VFGLVGVRGGGCPKWWVFEGVGVQRVASLRWRCSRQHYRGFGNVSSDHWPLSLNFLFSQIVVNDNEM
jgi:hypothetical protein